MDNVSKALHRREVMNRKVFRLARAIKNAYVTRLYGPFPYAKSRKTGPLALLLLALLASQAKAQSITTAVSPPTTQIDLSVVNPVPGTPLGRYVVSVGVTNSLGAQQVPPICLYVTQSPIGASWDTTTWPSDTYTITATLWLPPATVSVKSNCANISGPAYTSATDFYTIP